MTSGWQSAAHNAEGNQKHESLHTMQNMPLRRITFKLAREVQTLQRIMLSATAPCSARRGAIVVRWGDGMGQGQIVRPGAAVQAVEGAWPVGGRQISGVARLETVRIPFF